MTEATQKNSLEDIKTALERDMESLYRRAAGVVEGYYRFKDEMNRRMDWSEKSSLKPRVRQRGLSIAAEWCEVRWYGSKANGKRRVFTTYIAKPKSAHGYTLSKLLEYAQDWEIRAALAALGTPLGGYNVLIAGQARSRELTLVF